MTAAASLRSRSTCVDLPSQRHFIADTTLQTLVAEDTVVSISAIFSQLPCFGV